MYFDNLRILGDLKGSIHRGLGGAAVDAGIDGLAEIDSALLEGARTIPSWSQ